MIQASEHELQELCVRAGNLGANAVVGVKIDYECLGENKAMLMVTASGTTVYIE